MCIDIVFAWCDGSDMTFICEKNKRLREFESTIFTEDNIGNVRYIQCDELKYALRAIDKYAPWINHIFIITNKQKPSWLVNHSKITIIDHSEIIPSNLLPTFSSVCIEMFLDRIPGLSEKFIYANDDMIINRPMTPSDFFSADDLPIVWLDTYMIRRFSENQAYQVLNDKNNRTWEKTVIRAWEWYQKKNSKKIPLYSPAHSLDAYTKTLFRGGK